MKTAISIQRRTLFSLCKGVQLLSVALVLALSGCTTVHVHNAEVVTDHHLGIVNVRVLPDTKGATLVTTEGIGLTIGSNSAALGYISESVFFASDVAPCRLFVLVQSAPEFKAIQNLLLQNGISPESICLITKEERK